MKATPEENPDYEVCNKALKGIREVLDRFNFEVGKASDMMKLLNLEKQLMFSPGEYHVSDFVFSLAIGSRSWMAYQCGFSFGTGFEVERGGQEYYP